jgi:hypothetical protein
LIAGLIFPFVCHEKNCESPLEMAFLDLKHILLGQYCPLVGKVQYSLKVERMYSGERIKLIRGEVSLA